MIKQTVRLVDLLPLFSVIFFAFFGYSMMITVFTPLFINASFGTLETRVFWLGGLLGLYSIGQISGTPLILRMASKLGSKKTYLLSLSVTAIGYAFIAFFLESENWLVISLSIFVAGFSESNASMADQVIIDTSFKLNRSQWVGYIETSKSAAFLIGPPFAGLCSLIWHPLPFWTVFGCLLVAVLVLSIKLPKSRPKEMKTNFFETLKVTRFSPFFLRNFLAYFAIFGFFRAYPLDLVDRFDFNMLQLSLCISGVAIPMLLVTIWLNRLCLKHFSPTILAALGILICGIFMVFSPFISEFGSLMLIDLLIIGFGIGFCLPNAVLVISKGLPIDLRENVIEVDETFQLGSECLSSIVGGICGFFVMQLPLLVFAASAIIASWLFIKGDRISKVGKLKSGRDFMGDI